MLAALVAAHLIGTSHGVGNELTGLRIHQGLLAYDGGWYQSIAAHGFAGAGEESVRFFPLLPYLAHALAWIGPSPGVAVIAIANASALGASYLMYALAREVLGGSAVAERAVWLLALAPGAYALVLGYAEGLFLCLALGCLLALRRSGAGVTALAAVLAMLAATCRPIGLALAPAAALVLWRRWGSTKSLERSTLVAATLAPLAGLGLVLANSAAVGFGALAPLRVQTQSNLHGRISNPAATLLHAVGDALHGHSSIAMHLPWIAVALIGLLLSWRMLPGELTAFGLGVVLLALSGTNLDSFERYATCAVPLVLVAASLLRAATWFRVVVVALAAWLGLFSLLVFLNIAVA